MKQLSWITRVAIFAIAAGVIYSLWPVIQVQWDNGNGCPKLGPVPACYLVGLAYTAMGVAALFAPHRFAWIFFTGWTPVFVLAATGSTLELSGQTTCPVSASGVPLCYYSLTLAVALIPAFLFARRYSNRVSS